MGGVNNMREERQAALPSVRCQGSAEDGQTDRSIREQDKPGPAEGACA